MAGLHLLVNALHLITHLIALIHLAPHILRIALDVGQRWGWGLWLTSLSWRASSPSTRPRGLAGSACLMCAASGGPGRPRPMASWPTPDKSLVQQIMGRA
jgi:hypothetical protein